MASVAAAPNNNDVVVVAMACRYPQADSPEALWEKLLAKGEHAIGIVDRKRWRPQRPPPSKEDRDVPASVSFSGAASVVSASSSSRGRASRAPPPPPPQKKRGRDPMAERVLEGELPRVVAASLEAPEAWDAAFFGLSDGEAAAMDPHHRLALEVAAQAFHNAGYGREALRGQRVGVWVAVSNHEWQELPAGQAPGASAAAALVEGAPAAATHAAQRVSHFYGLKGPSLEVNSGCSSTLVVLDQAAASLRQGRCTAALVVGVHLLLGPRSVRGWQEAGLLSASGEGAVFAPNADGFVLGEGGGAVLLETKAQARARGHRTPLGRLAASSVSYGGSPFTSKPEELREELLGLMGAARDEAGLPPPVVAADAPRLVDYAEISGAGRVVFDAREAACLAAVYGLASPNPSQLLGGEEEEEGTGGGAAAAVAGEGLVVGCVKATLGHMDAASGMAGLLKGLLVLRHKAAPPQPRLDGEHGPHQEFLSMGMQVPRQLLPLTTGPGAAAGRPLRVAVSSLAWSGTNAHVLLEEVVQQEDGGDGVLALDNGGGDGGLRHEQLPPLEMQRRAFPWWHVEHAPLPEQDEEEAEEEEAEEYDEGFSQDSEATRPPRAKRPKPNPQQLAEERRARARQAKREKIKELMRQSGGVRGRRADMPQFVDDVRAKDAEAVGMWIEEGYRVMGESLLEAVRRGSLEIVKVMMEKGGGPEHCLVRVQAEDVEQDYKYAGLLHLAVLNDQPEMITYLAPFMSKQSQVAKGGKGTWHPGVQKDHWGYTPMHYAVKHRKWGTIAALVAVGHRMDDRDYDGNPPILWVTSGGMESLKELLRHGADVNANDKKRLTLLYWTITNQLEPDKQGMALGELAARLIEHGAHYGEKNTRTLRKDLSLGIESREELGSKLYVPVLVGDGPHDPTASLPPPTSRPATTVATAMAAAASVGMGGGSASLARKRRAAACASSSSPSSANDGEEEEDGGDEEEDAGGDGGRQLLAPPPERPYPLFAYLKEPVGNPTVDACEGCSCQGNCANNPACACRKKAPEGNGPYAPDGLLRFPAPAYIHECGPTCACQDQDDCGLRKTQRGIGSPVDVLWTGARGWGLFARTDLPRGTYIGTYMGEILSEGAAVERYDRVKNQGGCPDYQVEVELEGRNIMVIDATFAGNASRLINHSCEPNAILKKVHQRGKFYPAAAFFAARDIAKGEELTFNYDTKNNGNGGKKQASNESTLGGVKCECGASKCRGKL